MDAQRHPEDAAKPQVKRLSRRWPLVSGGVALGLAVALGFLIVVRDHGLPLPIDTQWMTELGENRVPVWDVLAQGMDFLGGGVVATFVLPVLIIVALLLAKRRWGAGYYVLATVLTGGSVQLLKNFFGRTRPENLLTNLDFGSFPSGHVANAATMAVVLAILFPRVWVWVAGSVYTAVMMLSRTYLGAHWLTDTLGALLLGVGFAIVVWAPLAAKLDGERTLVAEAASTRTSPALALRTLCEKFLRERRVLDTIARRRLLVTAIVLIGVGALFFMAVLSSVLQKNGLTVIDAPVQHWLASWRGPALTVVMIGLAILFGPIALPIILLVVTVLWGVIGKHARRPLLLAVPMLVGVVLAQVIGHAADRHRPPTGLMLFGPDPSFSFPSGHVLGAADFVLLTAYLVFSRRRGIRGAVAGFGGAVVCMIAAAVSRVYLGYHWATDALASVALSLVILGCLVAFDTWRSVRVAGDLDRLEAGAPRPGEAIHSVGD